MFGAKSSRPEFLEFENQIQEKKINLKIAGNGKRISIGWDIYFDILSPIENFEGREVVDFNTSSIVARLVFDKVSFLFTGDAPKSIEEELIKNNVNLDSDVLKVSHHGSRTSNSDSFLKAVNPEIAVIQVGLDNQWGHPHPEVLARLEKYGIKIFRTDLDGDIKIVSNGKTLRITNSTELRIRN